MKKTFKLLASTIIISIFCIGCNKPTETTGVNGQIFISTQGGQSFKLGSVKVSLVKASDIISPLTNYIDKLKIFDKECKIEVAKYRTKSEIYISKNDDAGLENLKIELLAFVLNKGEEYAENVKVFLDIPSVVNTSSDADGKFYLPISNPGKYVVRAFAIRKLSDEKTETYIWILPLKSNEQSIMLNSLNTTELFDPSDDSVISTLEKLVGDLKK